jgi:hypothetical protein
MRYNFLNGNHSAFRIGFIDLAFGNLYLAFMHEELYKYQHCIKFLSELVSNTKNLVKSVLATGG